MVSPLALLDKYSASERGTVLVPQKTEHSIGVAFASEYRYAMHALGFQQIYFQINGMDNFSAERLYYPDAEVITHHRAGFELHTQESHTKAQDLDMILFSLNYEGNYPKFLEMLDFAKIPVGSSKRDNQHPLIIGGGYTATYNPAPLSDFFDAIVIGEAEIVVPDMLTTYNESPDRNDFLQRMSTHPSVYVPSLQGNKRMAEVGDMEKNYFGHIISPHTYWPDFAFVESTRSCSRKCNFCVLPTVFSKQRNRSKEKILSIAGNLRQYTDKIRLVTPSDTDHPQIVDIYKGLKDMGYFFHLGSQRADQIKKREEMLLFTNPRTLTLAPEAADQSLRYRVGKNISDDHLFEAASMAAKHGIPEVQLFYITGFPDETPDETRRITSLTKEIHHLFEGTNTKLGIVINSHIKKPFTVYEREKQQSIDEYFSIIDEVRSELEPGISVTAMNRDALALEILLVRGGSQEGHILRKLQKSSSQVTEDAIRTLLNANFDKYFARIENSLPWDFIQNGCFQGGVN